MKKRIEKFIKDQKSLAIKELFDKETEFYSNKKKFIVLEKWIKILEYQKETDLSTYLLKEKHKIEVRLNKKRFFRKTVVYAKKSLLYLLCLVGIK